MIYGKISAAFYLMSFSVFDIIILVNLLHPLTFA